MFEDFENDQKTIIVVDDARINVSKAEYILKPKRYNVGGFESGDAFLLALKNGDIFPDLILLDIEMPQKSGIKVLEELRANPLYAELPVIFVTGHVSPELISKAASLKVSGYIKKPFEGQDLIKRVQMVLE